MGRMNGGCAALPALKALALLVFLHSLPFEASPADLVNQVLRVSVDEDSGRVFLAARAQSESAAEEDAPLLFYDRPPSSYTVVYVEDEAFIYGSTQGRFASPPSMTGESIESLWEVGSIAVRQSVRFVWRRGSIQDGVLISYEIENRGKGPARVGLRILFDTFLGERPPGKDGKESKGKEQTGKISFREIPVDTGACHFTLSDGEAVCGEMEIAKSNLPVFWRSQSPAKTPVLGLQGTLKGELVTVPEKVVFGNFRTLRQKLSEYRIRPGRGFSSPPFSLNDSAVALYFAREPLLSHGTREFRAILGLMGEGEYSLERERRKHPGTVTGEAVETAPAGPKPEAPAGEEVEAAAPEQAASAEKTIHERISESRESLDEINRLLTDIDAYMGLPDRQVTEEEILELKNRLNDIEQETEGEQQFAP